MKIRQLVVILIFIIPGFYKNCNAQTVDAQVDSTKLREESISFMKSLHDSTSKSSMLDSSKFIPVKNYTDKISEEPSLNEINNLFYLATIGKRDPYVVAGLISAKMDAAIPGLEEFLFTPVEKTKDMPGLKNRNAEKHYAIYALELIFTKNAENLLLKAAKMHPDKEVRGAALRSLAGNYLERIKSDSLKPDAEIIHALLAGLSDTSYSKNCGLRIGEIAGKGIKNWTGTDYKTLLGQKNQSISTVTDAEEWWRNNAVNVIWSKDKKRFTINR